jgi:CheY-like chemotaxis protein
MDQKNILLVEDDDFLSDMYKTKFESEGFKVVVAQDGEECLRALKEGLKPVAVLLDVVMPNMDGIEVLETIKNTDEIKDNIVIMLTNMGQKEEIDKAMSLGAKGYLVKANFTPSEVVREVQKILN